MEKEHNFFKKNPKKEPLSRCNFNAYCLFSLVNTVVYCIPAHWLWHSDGFLSRLGVVDIAGSGGVHLVGGASALVAAVMLGPRLGRWDDLVLTDIYISHIYRAEPWKIFLN